MKKAVDIIETAFVLFVLASVIIPPLFLLLIFIYGGFKHARGEW